MSLRGFFLFVTLTTGCVIVDDFDRYAVARDASADADASDTDAETDGGTDGALPDAPEPDGAVPDSGTGECAQTCTENQFCNAQNQCEAKRPIAMDCAGANECLSGFCDPDGICCMPGEDCCDSDAECAGLYRCDTAARECFGSCTVGTEASACKPAGHCSAANNCVTDLAAGAGNACDRDAMCAGNQNCRDNFCCDGSCGGCSACNRAGALGLCGPVGAGQDPHNACNVSGCTNDGSCNGNGGCRAVQAGQDPAGACNPSGCTNDGSCNGMGGCRVVAPNTDPNNACDGTCLTGQCNGTGACAPVANHTPCDGSNLCGMNECSGGVCTEFCSANGQAACTRCNFVWACTGGCPP